MKQDKAALLREEPPCIWAQAGVLSYRPCDRHYECDGCPLFHALQGGSGPVESEELETADVGAHLSRLIAGCTLHLDRAYSPGHWWVDAAKAPDLTLGIEGLVLRVLYPVDDIVAPHVGVWLRRSEPCGWILRGHTSIPLHAPIGGEVREVNGHFLDTLRVWSRFGIGDDWLIRLNAHEDPQTVPGLYRGDEALARLLKSIQLLKHALREAAGQQVAGVGVTLADGGEPHLDLEAVLGHVRFAALVDAMFHTHA